MRGCQPLSEAEEQAVRQAFGGRYGLRNKALFTLGCRTGFRVSELLSLRVGDVYQHGRLVDRVAVPRRHMKGKTEGRSVALHPDAQAAISTWLKARYPDGIAPDPTAPLFPSREGSGKALTRVRAHQILTAAYAAAGLTGKLATHSMRKTFAARVYARLGHDLLRLQRAMGHRNISSTMAYLSFAESEIDAAILDV